MIPISDENPTLRTPVVTIGLLAALAAVWFFVQGFGFNDLAMAASVCNWGLVPGEITGRARVGSGIPMGEGLSCLVDADPVNILTPITSMFLHGGWLHLLGNALYLWVFGNNVEDSMGRFRFLVFYLLCGLAAAGAQVLVNPASPVPMVGASGAISGVLGAYLVLYPRVRVRVLVPIFILLYSTTLPAFLVLLLWIGMQLLNGLPQLTQLRTDVSAGVAFWAHIGGFFAGVVLVKLFEDRSIVRERTVLRRRAHPGHW
jgi:membrane associated rhomboid family serine protease